MPQVDLTKSPSRLRAAPAKGIVDADPILRDGGDYGAGLIRGIAVVTRGEALGHDMWLDSTFVEQTAAAVQASKGGVKARFTHPSLSSDGMGKFLGRIKNGRMDGDVARADLHLAETAQDTPDGNLANYVMNLADEDPRAFATSISFEHDRGAETEFRGKNSDEKGMFKSPDPRNKKGYFHARLAKLYADDVVDDPAANPGGLFHRGDEIAAEADALLSYSLGLSDKRPEMSQLEIDPDRASGFVKRFLNKHGLSIVPKEKSAMSEIETEVETALAKEIEQPEAPAVTPPAEMLAAVNDPMARFKALKATFPKDPAFVAEQFEAGKTVEQAQIAFDRREVARLTAEVARLSKGGSAASGANPVSFGGGDAPEGGDFLEQARKLAKEEKIPIHTAMSRIAKENPALHESFVLNAGGHVPRLVKTA